MACFLKLEKKLNCDINLSTLAQVWAQLILVKQGKSVPYFIPPGDRERVFATPLTYLFIPEASSSPGVKLPRSSC